MLTKSEPNNKYNYLPFRVQAWCREGRGYIRACQNDPMFINKNKDSGKRFTALRGHYSIRHRIRNKTNCVRRSPFLGRNNMYLKQHLCVLSLHLSPLKRSGFLGGLSGIYHLFWVRLPTTLLVLLRKVEAQDIEQKGANSSVICRNFQLLSNLCDLVGYFTFCS